MNAFWQGRICCGFCSACEPNDFVIPSALTQGHSINLSWFLCTCKAAEASTRAFPSSAGSQQELPCFRPPFLTAFSAFGPSVLLEPAFPCCFSLWLHWRKRRMQRVCSRDSNLTPWVPHMHYFFLVPWALLSCPWFPQISLNNNKKQRGKVSAVGSTCVCSHGFIAGNIWWHLHLK